MSRRGRNAKARERRHRAAVALRSQSLSRTDRAQSPTQLESALCADGSRKLKQVPVAQSGVSTASPRTPVGPPVVSRPRPRRQSRNAVRTELETLCELVIARETATNAISAEVQRLRRFGANWAEIGNVLGVSRQAARQKYKT